MILTGTIPFSYLFSAEAFLTKQLGVDVYCIEVDAHPHGKVINKHITQKTKQTSVPVIFIKGEYLGGFETVNNLYSAGDLQRNYLQGVSQANLCELMLADSKSAAQPYFWFPAKVEGNVVRITGVLTCLSSVCSVALFWYHDIGIYVAYAIWLDFLLRLLGGARISLLGRIAMLIASPMEPHPRAGRPKQFATMCGVLFSFLGSLFYFLSFRGSDYIGAAFMGMLACASGMEGFLDFCLGCVFYRMGIELGLISK
jgi:glutaredoxin